MMAPEVLKAQMEAEVKRQAAAVMQEALAAQQAADAAQAQLDAAAMANGSPGGSQSRAGASKEKPPK